MDIGEEDQLIPQDLIYSSCMPQEWQTLRLPANIKNFTPPFQACQSDGIAYIIGDDRGYVTTLDLETFHICRYPSNPRHVAVAASNNGHCFVHGEYLVVVNHSHLFVALLPPRNAVKKDGSESEFVFEFDELTVNPAPPTVGLVSAARWRDNLVCFGGYDTNETWLMNLENLPAHLAALEDKKSSASQQRSNQLATVTDDLPVAAEGATRTPDASIPPPPPPATGDRPRRSWVRPIEWTRLRATSAPPIRLEHCSAVVGDHLLVVGGKHARGDVKEDAWCLDMEGKLWHKITFQNGAGLPRIVFNSCTHSIIEINETSGIMVMNCFGMRLSKSTCPFLAKIQLPLVRETPTSKWKPQSFVANLTLVGQTTSNNLLCVPSHSFYLEGVSYFIGLCSGEAGWNPICCVRPNIIQEWRPEFHHLYTTRYRKNAKAFLAACLKNGVTVPHDLCGEVFSYWANELHPEMRQALAKPGQKA